MQIRGSDFVMYLVKDMAQSLAFYRNTLGMMVEGEYTMEEGGVWVELPASPTTLALFQPSRELRSEYLPDKPENGPPAGGAVIALAVENVDAAVDELQKQGVQVVFHTQESPVCYFAMIRDPDGNGIVLHQRKDGTCG